ncbi:nucleotide disphospho-sugar-binding domain-containing protein [Phytohabitans rumicis]|uniref:nucleotide disphospho-sugar-binding domain-containing protein n=1 Tax=Phytohabitans rumicis TaxID=1076125 RepID=UPI001563CCB4|nr:nucleotide disphospho-sugar-binding domain-containing protein [Phytohabitans rumicis]
MRILFTPSASATRAWSLVPLAWACRADGHEVRFAAEPHVAETVDRCALPAVPVGPAAVARDLLSFAEWWRPDVVVADPWFSPAPTLAGTLGVPMVRHLCGPNDVPAAPDRAAFTVDPFPPSLQVPGLADRVTMRWIPFHGAAELPGWLAEPPKRPRVCVTGQSTLDLVDGLAELDVEVVPVAGLPLDLLLPFCSAVVSRGGASDVLTAAAYGVPQVVLAGRAEAGLLAATGAGVCLDADPEPAEMTAAVTAVLFEDGPRAAARRLRAEILAQPAPRQVVTRLAALAAG